jgi:hypothetical protein
MKLQLCSGSHFVGFERGKTIFTFRLGNDGFFPSDDLPHSLDFYNNLEVLFLSDVVVLDLSKHEGRHQCLAARPTVLRHDECGHYPENGQSNTFQVPTPSSQLPPSQCWKRLSEAARQPIRPPPKGPDLPPLKNGGVVYLPTQSHRCRSAD